MNADDRPYAGTSGHSGGPASESRARHQDETGGTGRLRLHVESILTQRRAHGATCAEVERMTGRGHGAVSGALSRMQLDGHVARLADQRDGQEIYVLPQHVHGRTVVPYRHQAEAVRADALARTSRYLAAAAQAAHGAYHEDPDVLSDRLLNLAVLLKRLVDEDREHYAPRA